MRAIGVVIRARRDHLDGIGAEDREIADVVLPLGQVPGIIRVGLGPIAELVPAERVARSRCHVEPARE